MVGIRKFILTILALSMATFLAYNDKVTPDVVYLFSVVMTSTAAALTAEHFAKREEGQ